MDGISTVMSGDWTGDPWCCSGYVVGLLSDFLLYSVDGTILGRTDEITEQRIGVTVFSRAEDDDPNDDSRTAPVR